MQLCRSYEVSIIQLRELKDVLYIHNNSTYTGQFVDAIKPSSGRVGNEIVLDIITYFIERKVNFARTVLLLYFSHFPSDVKVSPKYMKDSTCSYNFPFTMVLDSCTIHNYYNLYQFGYTYFFYLNMTVLMQLFTMTPTQ